MTGGKSTGNRTCAVVVKCYAWDAFVERQLARVQAGAGDLDVYLSVDDTSGKVKLPPWNNILRTNQSEILQLGLANRYEKGSLLWWNPDYTHYQVFETIPDYENYMFMEYDVYIRGGAALLMEKIRKAGAENVVQVRQNMKEWMWTSLHKDIYPETICRGSLNCITVHSRRSLQFLFEKRREMSKRDDIPFWPLSETFIPTELYLGGFQCTPLSDFGDISHYSWFPPVLEDDLDFGPCDELTFFHPVLDQARYVQSLLAHTHFVKDYFVPHSPLRRELGRFPGVVSTSDLISAAWTRGLARIRERFGGI
ncbi:hypothetical protein [Acetobacter fallax]|uniref:Uncharacterized protein n=1 Tax=Acetobacter fallax TaxID=1737473 RepID=A0ABX0KAC4_9PROT|nr:hypothetical protein [Acetobacter fallax]NHO33349.1 hypothetical protein [Acetobacter fallax]NHO36969.1 hypothetical protein [Acetobacter fallax]